MVRILYRLSVYKSFQLQLIEELQSGKDISTDRIRKIFDREHRYAVTSKLRKLKTTAEKTLWEYYRFLNAKADKAMAPLVKEYKDHMMTHMINEKLRFPGR